MTAEDLRQSGIYCIKNTVNGRVYIGSAVNIKRRWSQHKSDLRGNRSHAVKLQKSWTKYGESAFEFSVIEIVPDISLLIQREQYWIDHLNAAGPRNLNTSPSAQTTTGLKPSEEKLRKMSTYMKNNNPMNNPIHRAAWAESMKTRKHASIKWSEERKAEHSRKVREAGHRHSPEMRRRISERQIGGKQTDSHYRKNIAHIRSMGRLRSYGDLSNQINLFSDAAEQNENQNNNQNGAD